MNKYDLNRSKFLILISFLITFTILYLLSYIKGLEILAINGNDYLSSNSKGYNITIKNEQELASIKEAIQEMDVVKIKGSNNLVLLYFNEKAEYRAKINWLENKSDDSAYDIVLGKDLSKTFIESKKDKYELLLKDSTIFCNVAGILETSRFDFKDFSSYVLINLQSSNIEDFNGIYSVEGNQEIFSNHLKEAGIESSGSDIQSLSLSGSKFLSVQSIFGGIVLLLFLFTMVLIVKLWFSLYMKEAGVRIAFGGRKLALLAYILRKYILSVTIGTLIGIISFFIYYRLFLIGMKFQSLIPSVVIGFVFVFGISLFSALVNFIIFSRKSIREIIDI